MQGASQPHLPQTIISDPDQTAVDDDPGLGPPALDIERHKSVAGSYLAPAVKYPTSEYPPQMIISRPVQIAVCLDRPRGALLLATGVQASVIGLYRPPALR